MLALCKRSRERRKAEEEALAALRVEKRRAALELVEAIAMPAKPQGARPMSSERAVEALPRAA